MKKVILIIILVLILVFCFGMIKKENEPQIENVIDSEPILAEELITSLSEESLEVEAFEEFGDQIIYGATNVNVDYYKNREKLTAPVYFSQIDSKWKNIQYSSVGNPNQTIGSSGCGPTSASMIVSSITNKYGNRFTIYPNEMCSLYVSHGFRSADNGTYFSAFEWTANTFDIEFTRVNSTYDMADKINEGYYAIVSCSSGLFTTGGHYIVVYGREGDTLKIYDPYLYSGKFNSYGRSGKVTQSGNTVYCSISNFKAYANAKAFFLFKNNSSDTPSVNPAPTPAQPTNATTMYVNTSSLNLNVRSAPNGSKIDSLSKGTKVTVIETQGTWSHINSPVEGWVSSEYLANYSEPVPTPTQPTTSGTYKLKQTSYIYSNSNLTGTVYTYKANTTITVLSNVNDKVDYIRVNQTGRQGYIDKSNYISSNPTPAQPTKNTVGQYRRLNSRCSLYSNSNLTGNTYNYLPQTQVKIVRNVSSNIDYVYVVKTGRYGYINTRYYN